MEDEAVSRDLLSGLISELPFGLVLLELDGEAIEYNKQALNLLGVDEVQILTDNFIELIPSGPPSQAVSEVVKGKAARNRVETDIGGRSVSLIVQKMKLEGQADKLLLIVEDVSRFRDLERIKSEFITDMLHRLRTPLTSIRSGLSMLVGGQLGELTDKIDKVVTISHSQTNRMILLVSDLRNLLLIESHQMAGTFNLEDRPLKEIVEAALTAVETLARDDNVDVRAGDISDDLTVNVDRDHAVAALANVLSNAVIFSSASGQVEVSVGCEGARAVISVTDRGIGIAPENIPRTTEKFFREENEITRNREGNGLGLYLAKSLVELMDGGLRIESRQGYGTRVELSFRLGEEV